MGGREPNELSSVNRERWSFDVKTNELIEMSSYTHNCVDPNLVSNSF